MLEAAEVLKIGFYPDKLLACRRFMKIRDLFVFGKCGVRPISMSIKHTERQEMWDDLHDFADFCNLKNNTYHFISFHIFPPKQSCMAIVEIFNVDCLYNLSCQPDSQGRWRRSVCHPRSNHMVTRLPNVIVDVGLVVRVRMISVFLTRRDTTQIEAVHWEWGSANGYMLFQGSTCTRMVKLLHSL